MWSPESEAEHEEAPPNIIILGEPISVTRRTLPVPDSLRGLLRHPDGQLIGTFLGDTLIGRDEIEPWKVDDQVWPEPVPVLLVFTGNEHVADGSIHCTLSVVRAGSLPDGRADDAGAAESEPWKASVPSARGESDAAGSDDDTLMPEQVQELLASGEQVVVGAFRRLPADRMERASADAGDDVRAPLC